MTIKSEMCDGKEDDEMRNKKEDYNGKEINKAEEERLQDEISQLKTCLRDKDKRLTNIESKFKAIKYITLVLWYSFWIPFSYFILINVWIFIASGGRYIIFGFMEQLNKWYSSGFYNFQTGSRYSYQIPFALDYYSGMVLLIVMIFLMSLLTIGWYFILRRIEDDS